MSKVWGLPSTQNINGVNVEYLCKHAEKEVVFWGGLVIFTPAFDSLVCVLHPTLPVCIPIESNYKCTGYISVELDWDGRAILSVNRIAIGDEVIGDEVAMPAWAK